MLTQHENPVRQNCGSSTQLQIRYNGSEFYWHHEIESLKVKLISF